MCFKEKYADFNLSALCTDKKVSHFPILDIQVTYVNKNTYITSKCSFL